MAPVLFAAMLTQGPMHHHEGWDRRRPTHGRSMRRGEPARVRVNGRIVAQDAVLEGDHVMVPMRPIFEALGADVRWLPREQKVVAHKGRKTMTLTVGSRTAFVPERTRLNFPPQMAGDRVLVPLRFVSESLGANVTWNSDTMTARVEQ